MTKKRYSEYQQTSLPWLGEIPDHWEVVRLKRLFREVDLRSNDGVGTLMSLTRKRGLIPQTELTDRPPRAETLKGYKVCRPGQIVMNKMQAWNGMFGIALTEGLVSPDYTVLEPIRESDLEYFVRLFKTPRMIGGFHASSKGLGTGFLRLYTPDFYDIYVAYPPIEEQRAIVRYINQKLAQIDQFISYKRRLIELLNEQKTALINQAVTQGLDPNVPKKPSGIDCLENIPMHWEKLQIRRTLDSYDYGISDSIHSTGPIKVLTMRHLHDGIVDIPEEGSLDTVDIDLLLKDEDLLFNRTNSPELVGKVGIFYNYSEHKVSFASYLVRLRTNNLTTPKFMNYLLNSYLILNKARQNALHSLNQSNLNPSRYSQIEIPLPPIYEQANIILFIQKESYTVNNAVAQVLKEIELIQEYRTTLISDAVTGKIDVRDRLEVGAATVVTAGGV